MFLFGLESMSCDGKKREQAVKNDGLFSLVLEAGLEPARLLRPKDFKSFVSTDSTIRATLCFCCGFQQRLQRYNKRARYTKLALIFHCFIFNFV